MEQRGRKLILVSPTAPTLVRPCGRTSVCVFLFSCSGWGFICGGEEGGQMLPPHYYVENQLYPRVPDRSAYALIIKQWDSFISLVSQMPKIWLIIRWKGFPSLIGSCLLETTNQPRGTRVGVISVVLHKFLAARLRGHLGSCSSG